MSIKNEFLKNYFYLDFQEHEYEDNQVIHVNTNIQEELYEKLFLSYVTPILRTQESKGYNLDFIIFRGFVKNKEKPNSMILMFDGLDKDEIEV